MRVYHLLSVIILTKDAPVILTNPNGYINKKSETICFKQREIIKLSLSYNNHDVITIDR